MRKKQIFLSKSAVQTQKLAKKVVKDLLNKRALKGTKILALAGELGSGKTTFVQGLAKALGIKGRILSPTFVIMKSFDIKKLGNWDIKKFYHIDCYRLNKPEELAELDFKKIISQPENLVIIEWADKIRSLIPKRATWVKFEWAGEKERKICLNKKLKIINKKHILKI